MFTIDDYSWLDSPESQMHWQSISRDPSVPASAILKRLRQSLTIPQASLLLEQYELLTASRKKVANPGDWFWTRQLLEQSSDEETASETALDFPAGASVNDAKKKAQLSSYMTSAAEQARIPLPWQSEDFTCTHPIDRPSHAI